MVYMELKKKKMRGHTGLDLKGAIGVVPWNIWGAVWVRGHVPEDPISWNSSHVCVFITDTLADARAFCAIWPSERGTLVRQLSLRFPLILPPPACISSSPRHRQTHVSRDRPLTCLRRSEGHHGNCGSKDVPDLQQTVLWVNLWWCVFTPEVSLLCAQLMSDFKQCVQANHGPIWILQCDEETEIGVK